MPRGTTRKTEKIKLSLCNNVCCMMLYDVRMYVLGCQCITKLDARTRCCGATMYVDVHPLEHGPPGTVEAYVQCEQSAEKYSCELDFHQLG